MTRDEIRALENLPSKAGADKLTVNAALVPLDTLGAEPMAAPVASPLGAPNRLAVVK